MKTNSADGKSRLWPMGIAIVRQSIFLPRAELIDPLTVTDNCRRVKGTWFCFNGGSSYSGYGQAGFDRRFRVFHVDQYGDKITTWKRTEHAEKIDEMVL